MNENPATNNKPFIKEDRYLVFKRSDISQALTTYEKETLLSLAQKVFLNRQFRGKTPLEYVVMESDWPNYNDVWESVERVDSGSYKPADKVGEQDALIQRIFDAGFFGSLGYDEVMESLMEKGVVDALYYCECNNCGNCFEVVKVGSPCDNCNEGTMQPQDVEPWD